MGLRDIKLAPRSIRNSAVEVENFPRTPRSNGSCLHGPHRVRAIGRHVARFLRLAAPHDLPARSRNSRSLASSHRLGSVRLMFELASCAYLAILRAPSLPKLRQLRHACWKTKLS